MSPKKKHIPIKIMQTYNGILHAMNEMRLIMSHVLSPHRLHQTRVPTNSYHTMPKPMRDKIHHSWITSNDHFTKKKIICFQNKSFLDIHLNDNLFSKIHVSFMGGEFSEVPPQASKTFPHFYGLSPMDPFV